jgi:hypothetical protein
MVWGQCAYVSVTPCGAQSQLDGFLISVRHTTGLLGRGINSSPGLYVHRTAQYREIKNKYPCLKRELKSRSSGRELKTHASDRTATGSAPGPITAGNFLVTCVINLPLPK